MLRCSAPFTGSCVITVQRVVQSMQPGSTRSCESHTRRIRMFGYLKVFNMKCCEADTRVV